MSLGFQYNELLIYLFFYILSVDGQLYQDGCTAQNMRLVKFLNDLYFQLRKSIVQTALIGRAFPIFLGTSVPEIMVSPIIAFLGCKIYLLTIPIVYVGCTSLIMLYFLYYKK